MAAMSDEFTIVTDPAGNSVALSALFAVLPLITLFVLLGVLRVRAWLAGTIALVVALIVAVTVYAMPVGQAAGRFDVGGIGVEDPVVVGLAIPGEDVPYRRVERI